MKKPLSIITATAILAGCSQSTAVKFTLTGRDPAFTDGKYMYIITYAGGPETIIDSARIDNSSFAMKGSWPYPVSAFLYMGRGADGEQISDSDFILETGEIRVEKRNEDEFILTGTPQNEFRNELPQKVAGLRQKGLSPLRTAEACDSLFRAVVLENRNALLKQASKGLPVDREELVAWSESLALAATDVYLRRRAYLLGFAPRAEEQMSAISDEKETLLLTLEADTDKETPEAVADDYRACFLSHLERECAAGCTLFGPHRDDIGILLSGLDARVYASQGQQRSIVLALKLAEGEYNREKTGDYPVFLLDDVLSELDASRRAYLLGAGGERQLIVTSCEETMCGAAENIIRVSGGNYVSAYR